MRDEEVLELPVRHVADLVIQRNQRTLLSLIGLLESDLDCDGCDKITRYVERLFPLIVGEFPDALNQDINNFDPKLFAPLCFLPFLMSSWSRSVQLFFVRNNPMLIFNSFEILIHALSKKAKRGMMSELDIAQSVIAMLQRLLFTTKKSPPSTLIFDIVLEQLQIWKESISFPPDQLSHAVFCVTSLYKSFSGDISKQAKELLSIIECQLKRRKFKRLSKEEKVPCYAAYIELNTGFGLKLKQSIVGNEIAVEFPPGTLSPAIKKGHDYLKKHRRWEEKQICFRCRIAMQDMKSCGRCQFATYCSAECQKLDWKDKSNGHRKVCNLLARHAVRVQSIDIAQIVRIMTEDYPED